MRTPYSTEFSEDEGKYIEPHMPPPEGHGWPRIRTIFVCQVAIFRDELPRILFPLRSLNTGLSLRLLALAPCWFACFGEIERQTFLNRLHLQFGFLRNIMAHLKDHRCVQVLEFFIEGFLSLFVG
jgi:hypothetical protein